MRQDVAAILRGLRQRLIVSIGGAFKGGKPVLKRREVNEGNTPSNALHHLLASIARQLLYCVDVAPWGIGEVVEIERESRRRLVSGRTNSITR